MSAGKFLTWYARLWPRKIAKPPYKHIVQIGDSSLRQKCVALDPATIASYETKKVVSKLKTVMKKYNCVGLSAPQIGVNKRIFVMHLSEEQLKLLSEMEIEHCEMKSSPLMTFINPVMKVIDPKKVIRKEGCESIKGYMAEVPRYQEIHMSGFNEDGNEFGVTLNGWLSRIAQHELDHLDGKVYTDKMDASSLECICWREVNIFEGKVKLFYHS